MLAILLDAMQHLLDSKDSQVFRRLPTGGNFFQQASLRQSVGVYRGVKSGYISAFNRAEMARFDTRRQANAVGRARPRQQV